MRTEQEIWDEIKDRTKRLARKGQFHPADPDTFIEQAFIYQLMWVIGIDEDDIDQKMNDLVAAHIAAITEKEQER
jgi:hypothetical protein